MTSRLIKPKAIVIRMVGTQPLFRKETLENILIALENNPLWSPTHLTFDRKKYDYSHKNIFKLIDDEQPRNDPPYEIYIARRALGFTYSMEFYVGTSPHIKVDFGVNLPLKYWPNVFELADLLVKIFKPDFGVVHIVHSLKNTDDCTDRDWSINPDKDILNLKLLNNCGNLYGANYSKGILGLAMRTYFGPYFANSIGIDFLKNIPAIVTEGVLNTIQIDLAEKPWLLDTPALLMAWEKAMKYLWQSPVIATYKVRRSGLIEFEKGEKSIGFRQAIVFVSENLNALLEDINRGIYNKKAIKELDISKLDIPVVRFSKAYLSELKALSAKLQNSWFDESTLILADFQSADLLAAYFNNATIAKSNFRDSNLKYSNFGTAHIRETNFSNANIYKSNFAKSSIQHSNFEGANLEGCTFGNAVVRHCSFRKANLQNIWMEGADFSYCDFTDADLRGSNFKKANLEGAKLDKAILSWKAKSKD